MGVFGFNQTNEFGGVVTNGVTAPPQQSSLYHTALAPAGAVQLVGGDSYFDALYADGSVWGWGGDAFQAEGVGNHQWESQPPQEVFASGISELAAGHSHTLFLASSGAVYASGDNEQGDVGDTGACCGYFPSPVQVSNLSGATAIAASFNASFALLSNGTVATWGEAYCQRQADNDAATVIPNFSGVTAIASAGGESDKGLALKSDGTVWIFGEAMCGAPTEVPNLTGVASLGVGGDVIKSDGTVWSVGSSGATQVTGLSNVTSVYSSDDGSVSLALESDGSVWSWGADNQWGELGDGTVVAHAAPRRVALISGGVTIAAADFAGAVAATSIVPPAPAGGPLTSPELFGGKNPSEICLACAAGRAGDPVNTADGDFYETHTDLRIPGRGLPLDFARTYSSLAASTGGLLGYGWSFTYGMALSVDGSTGNVTITQENGSQVVFAPSGGSYVAPPRVQATLVHNSDGTWLFTRRARTRFTFESTGRLASEADLNGYTTTVAYPSASSMVITDPAGRTLTCTLASGRITSVVDSSSLARTVSFGYDSAGDLTTVTDVGKGVTTYTYDANHRLVTIRAPRFAKSSATSPTPVITNQYDSSGRLISQTNQVGATTTFDYTSVPGSTEITDPNGNVTLDKYENGLRVQSISGYGTSSAAAWSYYYDPTTLGLSGVCDPDGDCRTAIYDANGNVLTQTDALGRTTSYTYDGLNDLTSQTDPSGVTTTMTYDSNGNLLTRSRPLLSATGTTLATQTTTYGYGGTSPTYAGDVTSVTDPDGKVTQYRYDAYGDLVAVTAPPTPENPSGDKTTYTYNTGTGWQTAVTTPKGNLKGATKAAFTTSYSYDPFGHVTRTRDPLWSSSAPTQHQVSYKYDADGNLSASTDGDGKTTSYSYNAAEELTQMSRPDGTTESWDYWPNGEVHDSYQASGGATTYTYNALGQLATSADALNRTTTYHFDPVGNLTARCTTGTWSGCTSYTYDGADELTGISYDDGKTPTVTNITYNADGERTGMSDGTGTSAWTWDSLKRLTTSTDGYGNQVAYGYDLDGHLTSLTYPGNHIVTYDYDASGRMDWVTDWESNKTTFGYDADSNLTTATLPSASGVVDAYSYDATEQLTGSSVAQGTSTLAAFNYTRDGADQVLTSATSGISDPAQSYAYNSLEQLTQSGPSTAPVPYSYDPDGNLTASGAASTLAYDAADQLCWSAASTVSSPTCGSPPAGATTYSYDAQGDRTQSTTGSASTTYTYDEADRLTAYGTSATYAYDGDGLRLAKTVSGSTQHFVWDHASNPPLLLADGTNDYIYGPSGLPLEQISSNGTVTYLHHDQLGSTRLLTNASGAVVGTYTYAAYGAQAAHTGTTTTPLGFAGQYTDAESGLIYMRARYYDPQTGQFLTRDPLQQITEQPYLYANDDPVNDGDPTGEDWVQGGVEGAGRYASYCQQNPAAAICTSGAGALDAVGSAVGAIGSVIVNHYGQVAEGLAGAACIAGVVTAPECLLATGLAFGASTVQNVTSSCPSIGGGLLDLLGTIPGVQTAGADTLGLLGEGVGKAAMNALSGIVGGGALLGGPAIANHSASGCGCK